MVARERIPQNWTDIQAEEWIMSYVARLFLIVALVPMALPLRAQQTYFEYRVRRLAEPVTESIAFKVDGFNQQGSRDLLVSFSIRFSYEGETYR
jgi:hypothetical protein